MCFEIKNEAFFKYPRLSLRREGGFLKYNFRICGIIVYLSLLHFQLYVGLGVTVMVLLIAGFCFLAWYSSSLKHKLDGYSRMNYADDDDNYTVSRQDEVVDI